MGVDHVWSILIMDFNNQNMGVNHANAANVNDWDLTFANQDDGWSSVEHPRLRVATMVTSNAELY